MAEGAVQAEDLARAPSVAFAAVGDDALGGAFGDVAGRGDVAKTGDGVADDDEAA